MQGINILKYGYEHCYELTSSKIFRLFQTDGCTVMYSYFCFDMSLRRRIGLQVLCIVVHRGNGIPARTGSRVNRKKMENKPFSQRVVPNYLVGGNLTTFYIVAKFFSLLFTTTEASLRYLRSSARCDSANSTVSTV
jgi:hypothetical protein